MRTPWLLLSIAVHGVAVAVALVAGIYAHRFVRPPVARVEIRHTQSSPPAHAEVRVLPDVAAEHARDAQPLLDVDVPMSADPESELVIDEGPLPASPSTILNRATTERVRRKRQEPAEEAQAAPPPAEVLAENPPQVESVESAYTAATRSKDYGDPPIYPTSLQRRNREGRVVLRVSVLADGSVAAVQLKAPSRYAGFNDSALRAVRKWRFEPATRGGVPVASELDLPIVFELTDR